MGGREKGEDDVEGKRLRGRKQARVRGTKRGVEMSRRGEQERGLAGGGWGVSRGREVGLGGSGQRDWTEETSGGRGEERVRARRLRAERRGSDGRQGVGLRTVRALWERGNWVNSVKKREE